MNTGMACGSIETLMPQSLWSGTSPAFGLLLWLFLLVSSSQHLKQSKCFCNDE